MIKFVLNYCKSYKFSLLVVIICSMLIAIVNLMEPYLMAKFIDEILIAKDTSRFYNFILIVLIISILAITSFRFSITISQKMQIIISNNIITEIIYHVHKINIEKLFKIDMIYLSKRIERDVKDLITFAIDSMMDICINMIMFFMSIFLLWSIDSKWLIIFCIIWLIHIITYNSLKKILFNRSTAVRETEAQYFSDFIDNFLYIYSIKLHSLYNEYIDKFRNTFTRYLKTSVKEIKIKFWFERSHLNANEICKVIIFALGGFDVLNGKMTVGNFVALNGYYALAVSGISYFMSIGQGYQNALAAYTRIMEIKNMPIETNGTKVLDCINVIEVTHVDYSFDEQKILTDFNYKFERGKIYCIVGKNGAGKSTLINLICGMLKLQNGEIKYNSTSIDEFDMIAMRKNNIAVVEQKDFLKNDNLSGGERRKVSINKAFDKSADVLIMDEPDNNLDTNAIDELINKINDNKQNRITIIISHDERITAIADNIVDFSTKY